MLIPLLFINSRKRAFNTSTELHCSATLQQTKLNHLFGPVASFLGGGPPSTPFVQKAVAHSETSKCSICAPFHYVPCLALTRELIQWGQYVFDPLANFEYWPLVEMGTENKSVKKGKLFSRKKINCEIHKGKSI